MFIDSYVITTAYQLERFLVSNDTWGWWM